LELKRSTPDADEEYLSIHYDKNHQLYFVGMQSGEVIKNTFRPVLYIIIISLVIIVCMNMILVHIMTKSAFKPLKELTDFILDVSVENLKLDIDINDDNNIVKLNEAFVLLFERINSYMDQMMTLQSMEMKAQFNALQAQMSPHFIFNTISVIHASAQEIGASHIMTMCEKLSDMIRYVGHYNGAPITINDEINHINNYLELMSKRFEGKFTYTVDIDDRVGMVEVPKMILQPIVENTFNHGFSKIKAPWHIKVKAYQQGNAWRVEVIDNGIGLSEEELVIQKKKILQYMSSEHDAGMEMKIGGMSIVNIVKRLRLQFGEGIVFDMIQVEPRGLKIIIGGRVND
jgi:two-component system sensor histidine kinase YesM